MFGIDSTAFKSFCFEINKFEYSFSTPQKRNNFIISYRNGTFNLYTFFKRTFQNLKVNALVHQDFYCHTFSISEDSQEKMFRTYMTVTQSYSLFLGITQNIFNPL